MATTKAFKIVQVGIELTAVKGVSDFQRNLRAQVRLRWNDLRTDDQFIIGINNAIDRGFRQAWRAGAAECGVKMNELTPAERQALEQKIFDQFPYITTLGAFVAANTRAEGGKLATLYGRLNLWTARYQEVVNQAKAMACKDKKLMWTLGAAEHCPSCLKLAGKVKRGSFWTEQGILPRQAGAGYLECGGFNCQCTLVPTDAPITPGPLPRLP